MFTKGSEFKLDGENYIGFYNYSFSNYYTEKEYKKGISKLLIEIKNNDSLETYMELNKQYKVGKYPTKIINSNKNSIKVTNYNKSTTIEIDESERNKLSIFWTII